MVKKCEGFDLQKEVWRKLPDFDGWGCGINVITIKNRYVIGFGGRDDNFDDVDSFRQIDSLRLDKGWKKLQI